MEPSVHKPGDICPDCLHDGVKNHLREFLISLEDEKLLKCESDTCMYPYNDEMSSSAASTDDERELQSNLDLLLDNLQNANTISNSQDIKESSELCAAKAQQFEFTHDSDNHKQSKPFLLEFKQEPLFQFKMTTSLPAKKTKVEIQSITTIKTEPITQMSTKPTTCNTNNTAMPMQSKTATTCGLPKASLLNGRQFLQQMEVMDKKSPYISHKVKKTLKSTNKIKKERKNSDKLCADTTPKHTNFDQLSKFLLNNINSAQNNNNNK